MHRGREEHRACMFVMGKSSKGRKKKAALVGRSDVRGFIRIEAERMGGIITPNAHRSLYFIEAKVSPPPP